MPERLVLNNDGSDGGERRIALRTPVVVVVVVGRVVMRIVKERIT
jgi:hypothetical protein